MATRYETTLPVSSQFCLTLSFGCLRDWFKQTNAFSGEQTKQTHFYVLAQAFDARVKETRLVFPDQSGD